MADLFNKDAPETKPKAKTAKTAAVKPGNNVSAKDVKKFAAANPAKVKAKPSAPKTGTAVTVHKPQPPRAPAKRAVSKVTTAGDMMRIIATAAGDPNVDVSKMERLIAMQKDLSAQQASAEFTTALIKASASFPKITQKGRISIEGKGDRRGQNTAYAKFPDINKAVKPALQTNGLMLRFHTGTAADGKITVTAILSHIGGHREETTITLPYDAGGSKNSVQAVGSSISYGKRYTMVAILNLISEDEEDDDGNLGANVIITPDELNKIVAACEFADVNKELFCQHFKIQKIADLPGRQFHEAMEMIAKKKAQSGR